MTSGGRPDDNRDNEGDNDNAEASRALSQAEAALKARLGRKRTKTGCLTCRKRRIKCGEERPVCKNCVKSRRHCEGYTQRVLLRSSTLDFQPTSNGGAHITFHAGPESGVSMPFQHGFGSPFGYDTSSFPSLQPRLMMPAPPVFNQPAAFSQTSQVSEHDFANQLCPGLYGPPSQAPARAQYPPSDNTTHQPEILATPQSADGIAFTFQGQAGASSQFSPEFSGQAGAPQFSPQFAGQDRTRLYSSQQPGPDPPRLYPPQTSGWDGRSLQSPHFPGLDTPLVAQESRSRHSPHDSLVTGSQFTEGTANILDYHFAQQTQQTQQTQHTQHASESSWSGTSYTPRPELTRPIDHFSSQNIPLHGPGASPRSDTKSMTSSVPEDYQQFARTLPDHGHTQMLEDAAVEVQDDDYYDVESDHSSEAEMAFVTSELHSRLQLASAANVLGATHTLGSRAYDSFLHHGILDTYRVERVANPLRNPATARVFMHFLTATGPSLSPFERDPFNLGSMFSTTPVPVSQRGLWSYTMPMAALHNQGLLHAILALASLHIARLQGASATPSMQHYAWSLKRIHNAVANRKKRLHVSTIAASMLLGFYEIMAADHSKWNTHLAGAKQLFCEIDFSGMMSRFREMKVERQVRLHQQAQSSTPSSPPSSDDLALDSMLDIDETVVSQMFGREVRYGRQGFVENDVSIPAPLDLGRFEILKDLYWWYCKQDAYQSLISGNPLLMDYSRWALCPPRAPMNRSDAVYGTFDHLTLLLGRIAAFSAKDKVRKLKEMEKTGGQWVPHPASRMAKAPPRPGNAPMPGPEFYGMTPAPRTRARMPASYTPLDGVTSPVTEQSEWTMEAALAEYEEIHSALRLFKASLGEAFQPLEPPQPVQTPFGTALFYRSYDIGILWSIYNMAVIVAIRSHPYHHPAAHFAAGMAASETVGYANEIGRIAGGIVLGPPDTPIDAALGTALVESTMPSFFAGIQYQTLEQRHSTVMRIYNIARRTGWGTADLIANGCETAWVKAAAAGRGPPYQRIIRPQVLSSTDSRLNGSYEALDPRQKPDESDLMDRRHIKEKAVARLQWAIGIMGTENDI